MPRTFRPTHSRQMSLDGDGRHNPFSHELSSCALNLQLVSLPEDRPKRLLEAVGHALQGGKPEISASLLEEPVLSPMHFNVISEPLLAPVLRFAVATDHVANPSLQGSAGSWHDSTLR